MIARQAPSKSDNDLQVDLDELTMVGLGIKEAFARYGACLRNVQWSVSAWAPDGSLVVSLWEHHRREGLRGTLEFAASANRWKGPGNTEFRNSVAKAFECGARVLLMIVHAEEVARVEAGEDGSKIKKLFLFATTLSVKF